MVSQAYRSPYDPLSRANAMPPAVHSARLAFKIGVGALLGLVLAIAGNLTDAPQSAERLALPAEAPPSVPPTPAPGGAARP